MDTNRFWTIIETATGRDPKTVDDWDDRLVEQLVKLSTEEIQEWDRLFNHCMALAYRYDLWAAAYLINGGASYDGFYYFRCWLIGMGRDTYTKALEAPDSLADVVSSTWLDEGIDAEATIDSVASSVGEGAMVTLESPEKREIVGDKLDFEEDEVMRQALPRLFSLLIAPME